LRKKKYEQTPTSEGSHGGEGEEGEYRKLKTGVLLKDTSGSVRPETSRDLVKIQKKGGGANDGWCQQAVKVNDLEMKASEGSGPIAWKKGGEKKKGVKSAGTVRNGGQRSCLPHLVGQRSGSRKRA